MTWLDVVMLLLILLITAAATWQGILRAGVSLVGFYLGGKFSAFLAERLAPTIALAGRPETNKAIVFIIAFLILCGLTLGAAHLIALISQFSLEEAEHLIALPIGLLISLTITHWFLQILVWLYPSGAGFHALLNASPVAKELLTFQATKNAAAFIFGWLKKP